MLTLTSLGLGTHSLAALIQPLLQPQLLQQHGLLTGKLLLPPITTLS